MPPRDLFLDLSARPVIGHRGASGLLPENTLPAFALALALGVDGLEFDVRLSADGVPVVHHDPTLERTTNLRGPVGARTAAELAGADAGNGHGVPSVEVVLEATGDLPLLIELKEPRVALPLLQVVRRCGAEGRVVMASFHPVALAPLAGSGIPVGASRPEIAWAAAAAAFRWPARLVSWQFYAVPDRYRNMIPVPTDRFVRRAREQGCPVHVWTVDDPDQAVGLWGLGVAGILTNRPDLILPARSGLAGSPTKDPR